LIVRASIAGLVEIRRGAHGGVVAGCATVEPFAGVRYLLLTR
jgi:hypothetical protein